MDLRLALEELPEQYAAALRLRLAGGNDDAVAAQLGIDPAGVPSMMRIATAKLATLLTVPDPPQGGRQVSGTAEHAVEEA